jgi:hypothetical protein
MKLLLRLRRFVAESLPTLALQAETVSPTSEPGEGVGRLMIRVGVVALEGRQARCRRGRVR